MGRKDRNAVAVQHRDRGNRKKGAHTDVPNAEDFDALMKQLAPLGLTVRKMDTDGNCLFRAFSDQIVGHCGEHMKFREECCQHMRDNIDEFAAFHADEEFQDDCSFEEYITRMQSPCQWGSQVELMALCRMRGVNAIVHQFDRPTYEMIFAPISAHCIQLSYHDGEHYNSIRLVSESGHGQPASLLSLEQIRTHGGGEESKEVQQVRESLPPGCNVSVASICRALTLAGGDVDAATEAMLCEDLSGILITGPSGSGEQPKPKQMTRRDRKKEKKAAGRKARGGSAQHQDDVTELGSELPDEALSLLRKQLLAV